VAGQILAMGGSSPGRAGRLHDLVLELAGRRVCFVPTASTNPETALVSFYESFAHRAEPSHVVFHPWPREDLREHVLSQDAIYVGGGNTANMLAIWRAHGFDRLLREAWERDILLCGWSAGMICWFEAGVTDSFGPQLVGMSDLLGFLPGSACPHYDSEEARRPVYRELVANGFPPGYAADDDVALHFVGTVLHEVVATRAGARAYRVEPGAETPIEPRLL
jgi:peptidase E